MLCISYLSISSLVSQNPGRIAPTITRARTEMTSVQRFRQVRFLLARSASVISWHNGRTNGGARPRFSVDVVIFREPASCPDGRGVGPRTSPSRCFHFPDRKTRIGICRRCGRCSCVLTRSCICPEPHYCCIMLPLLLLLLLLLAVVIAYCCCYCLLLLYCYCCCIVIVRYRIAAITPHSDCRSPDYPIVLAWVVFCCCVPVVSVPVDRLVCVTA